MKNNKYSYLGLAVAVSVVFTALVMFSLNTVSTQAAPAFAPTPVAAPDAAGIGVAFSSQTATALTADTNTASVDLLRYKTLDVEYVIDQGTVNTTTITLQYSIDGSAWTDGVAVVTSNAADVTALTVRLPVFGRYIRFSQDVATSSPVTITLSGVAR